MDAFDADVLIFAASPDHPLRSKVLALFPHEPVDDDAAPVGVGSTLLYPELFSKPLRLRATSELDALTELVGRLELHPLDDSTAKLAATLGAAYSLRAADAVHLATAVAAGADRFLTNNRRHFPQTITEVDVTYPDDL